MALFGSKNSTTQAAPAKGSVKSGKKKVSGAMGGARLTKTPERILLNPHITEKAARMTLVRAYVFEVAQDATKRDVVAAMRAIYSVTPRKVTIVRMAPRAYIARMRNRRGMHAGVKRAYVFLKEGDKIKLS